MTRTEIINEYLDMLGNEFYLEIGTANGNNFVLVNAKHKVGCDVRARDLNGIIPMSSNDFFRFWPKTIKFDVIFIDGDHSYEQSLKDLIGAVQILNPDGAIVLHDCLPNKVEETGETKDDKSPWYGNVYKTLIWARQRLHTVCHEDDCGCGVVVPDRPIEDFPVIPKDYTFDDYLKHKKEWMGVL